MTTYGMAAPDGKTYRIDGPEGASDSQIRAEIIRQNPHLAPPAPAKPAALGVPDWALKYPRLYGVAGAARETLGPLIEAGAMIGGGIIGTGVGPAGTVGGAGLGYGIGAEINRLADVGLGNAPSQTLPQAATRAATNVATGATMEAGGRVIAPIVGAAISRGGAALNQLVNPKAAAYVKAVEGRGQDIVNALRSPSAVLVPGSAPSVGEIAAPKGSTQFAQFFERFKPGQATEFHAMEAQSNAARIAQEARSAERFGTVAGKLEAKINAGLTDVSQRKVGRALIDIAEDEQKIVKRTVVTPAYTRAFNEAGNTKINVNSVVADAEKILERKLSDFAPETAPNTVRKLLSFTPKEAPSAPIIAGVRRAKPEPLPAEATLQQLDDVRKAINADIAAAKTSAAPSSDMTLRNLYKMHDSIDAAIADSTTLTPQAKQLYTEAVSKYRTEYIPRFKTGINANLFKQTSLNEPKLNADDVVAKFFQPKGEREASQFIALFGDNPTALRLGRTGIEDLYRQRVVDAVTGQVSPAQHAAFMKDYSRPIDIMDAAGMNLGQRFDVIGRDAARLAKIQEMAVANGVTLRDPLPAGASADAVARRVQDMTRGFTPRQLSDVSAVARDVAREKEHYRLASKAMPTGGVGVATEATKGVGLPAPGMLSTPMTVFNAALKRLTGKIDDKIAMEIARELSSPAMTAQMIEQSIIKMRPSPRHVPHEMAAIINALTPADREPVNALSRP